MWLVTIALVLFVSVVPVMVAARLVGARRKSFGACLGALLVATLISWFAVRNFHAGGLLSVFASALGYMAILDTTYLRGLAISLIQGLLTVLLVFVLASTVIFGGILDGLSGGLIHQQTAPATDV